MARLLVEHPVTSMQQAGMGVVGLLLCAFAVFACASHSRRWRRWNACYDSYNDGPVIHNNEPMMLTTGVYGIHGRDVDESMFSGEQQQVSGPMWKKNILMGEKCQLPDFSGVIIYNSDGNVVNPAKNARPLLTWK